VVFFFEGDHSCPRPRKISCEVSRLIWTPGITFEEKEQRAIYLNRRREQALNVKRKSSFYWNEAFFKADDAVSLLVSLLYRWHARWNTNGGVNKRKWSMRLRASRLRERGSWTFFFHARTHAIRDFRNREIYFIGAGTPFFWWKKRHIREATLSTSGLACFTATSMPIKFWRTAIRCKRMSIEITKEQSDKLDFVEIKSRFLYVLRVPRNDRNTWARTSTSAHARYFPLNLRRGTRMAIEISRFQL